MGCRVRLSAVIPLCFVLAPLGCSPTPVSESPDKSSEELVETALKSNTVRILEQQLARIPQGTQGRDRVVARLEELRARDREAAGQDKERRIAAAEALVKKQKRILASLDSETDEFQEATFYKHPKTPVLGTQTHLYIVASNDHYTLRLVATYEGENWIFWNKLILKAGESLAELDTTLGEVNRDNSGGTVWETLDAPVAGAPVDATEIRFNEATAPVFTTLMQETSASIRFQGQSIHDHKLSRAELARIKEVGNKYLALFGVSE